MKEAKRKEWIAEQKQQYKDTHEQIKKNQEKRKAVETQRILLSADGPVQGLCIPMGQWHGIHVLEPTVILECKDGKYEPLKDEDLMQDAGRPR